MTQVDRKSHTAPEPVGKTFLIGLGVGVSAGLSLFIAAVAFGGYSSVSMPKWVLARSAGLTGFVLLTFIIALGLLLSHPHRSQWKWPAYITRMRIHVGFAVFTLAFTALHVIVLVTDDYAHVGLAGAILPFASPYRPLPVTLGIIGLWAGLAAGITAARAGHKFAGKIWWVLHKIAISSYVLIWFHSLFAGSDPGALLPIYLGSAMILFALAIWRYASRAPSEMEEKIGLSR